MRNHRTVTREMAKGQPGPASAGRKANRSDHISQPRKAHNTQACRAPRPGQKCPRCGRGTLAYDGLLQLSSPVCGHVAEIGGFT
jgi:hypothetical protein